MESARVSTSDTLQDATVRCNVPVRRLGHVCMASTRRTRAKPATALAHSAGARRARTARRKKGACRLMLGQVLSTGAAHGNMLPGLHSSLSILTETLPAHRWRTRCGAFSQLLGYLSTSMPASSYANQSRRALAFRSSVRSIVTLIDAFYWRRGSSQANVWKPPQMTNLYRLCASHQQARPAARSIRALRALMTASLPTQAVG